MTEPETTPRRGRRARALSAEESAALEARAAVEATGEQSAVPGVRGAVAPPTAESPVPTLRKFGRRARIIELSEAPAPEVARPAEPAPEAPVEYESMAMRGSTPNWAAVAADDTAMSASCSTVGSGMMAQSP